MKWVDISTKHSKETCSWQGQLGNKKSFRLIGQCNPIKTCLALGLLSKQLACCIHDLSLMTPGGRPRGGGHNRLAWIDSSICIYSMALCTEPNFFIIALCFVLMLCDHALCFVLRAHALCLSGFLVTTRHAKHEAWSMRTGNQLWPKYVILSSKHKAQSMSTKQPIMTKICDFEHKARSTKHKAQCMSTKHEHKVAKKTWALSTGCRVRSGATSMNCGP
jgi:hypothetical protein